MRYSSHLKPTFIDCPVVRIMVKYMHLEMIHKQRQVKSKRPNNNHPQPLITKSLKLYRVFCRIKILLEQTIRSLAGHAADLFSPVLHRQPTLVSTYEYVFSAKPHPFLFTLLPLKSLTAVELFYFYEYWRFCVTLKENFKKAKRRMQ